MSTIRLNHVTKSFRGAAVLRDICLEFRSGGIYGIVGENGSGKTMLLRAVSGLIVPSSGTVTVDGAVLHRDISFPPEIGILIEKPEFLGHLSGLKNLSLLAEIRSVISTEKIADLMRLFALDPGSPKPMRKYSLGMRQKIGIIQAIMEDQKILVLDEAFNSLDEYTVGLLRELLLAYKKQGKLIILTSHNSEDIACLCDCVHRISGGRIVSREE